MSHQFLLIDVNRREKKYGRKILGGYFLKNCFERLVINYDIFIGTTNIFNYKVWDNYEDF